jgi:hypothetical protein
VQRGLADPEGGRGGGEVAVLGEHAEGPQRVGFQQVPDIHNLTL